MPDWCDPCRDCPRKWGLRAIGGDGPRPARVLAIMERPGQDENRNGRVACGKTGQELDELYLPLVGLQRHEIRVCNTVLCGHESNKTPTPKEVEQCAPSHIPNEIERTDPEVILLLGATACSLVSGGSGIRLDMHHGIPQHTSKVGTLFGWEGWLVPMFHPSMGMHESRFMQVLMDDWTALKDILTEDYLADDPETELSVYKYVRGAVAVNDYMQQASFTADDDAQPAMDTESHAGYPWSMQVSVKPGTGILIRADDADGLGALEFWFNSSFHPWSLAMHHAAHDLREAGRMRVRVSRYRDTMQEAFHFGNLPQGLKALSYRLFRHTMTSYGETVRPASISKLEGWLIEAFCIAQLDFTQTIARYSPKTGKRLKDEVRKSELETLLTRLLRLTRPDSEYDPWERLDAFWQDPVNEWMVEHVEARINAYPRPGIANCTMADAVRYAVGDADWTGRVATEFDRRRPDAFRIYEGDRDR